MHNSKTSVLLFSFTLLTMRKRQAFSVHDYDILLRHHLKGDTLMTYITEHPVIIKCLNCNQTYEATWNKLTRDPICSCAKSHQHKIINVDYYIKHYLENEWELLNHNQYKNSNSILKLKHKCGHVITQKSKTLHKNKGICYNCEKTGFPRKNIWTPQVFAELKAQEVSKSLKKSIRCIT